LVDEFACLEYNTLVETNRGLVRIGQCDGNGHQLITGDHNQLEAPSNYIVTPVTDVYEIKLENGFVIRCSKDHQVYTQDGWKKPLELTTGDYIESNNYYKFPSDKIIVDNVELDERLAWFLGILISEGAVAEQNYFQITTTNKSLAYLLQSEYGFSCKPKNAYVDNRSWNCKKSYKLYLHDKDLRKLLYNFGLDYVTAYDKKIPWSILQSPREVVMAFMTGLFEGDGSCFLFADKTCDHRLGVAYYSVSEVLCRDVHVLLDKLGYVGYINNRKSAISDNLQWFVRLNGNDAINFASQLNIDRFQYPLQNCYSPPIPTYICWDKNRNKWKVTYTYCGNIIQKRFGSQSDAHKYIDNLKSQPRFRRVKTIKKLQQQQHLYDYYLPQTHSFYAGGSRQHNSLPQEIFEVVIKGFSSVSASPVERSVNREYIKVLKSLGMYSEAEDEEDLQGFGNQTVITGTASYYFNHYYNYWKRYKAIVESCGNQNALEEVFHGQVPEGFDWTQFSVMRIPWQKLPDGFMDESQISHARATMHFSLYGMEYECIFMKDSDGFFRRSLIESCVTTKPIILQSGPVQFTTTLCGNPNLQYVYGIDPASESDNFAIVVLEIQPDHRRVVYCWTMTRQRLRDMRLGTEEMGKDSFYNYCARKIRNLMKVFPTTHIGMDTQGGGIAVMEALHDKTNLEDNEYPIWPYIARGKEDPFFWEKPDKPTDGEPGLHYLHMVQFANSEFVVKANHWLKKDFETRSTLFPEFNSIEIALAIENDKVTGRTHDTLEDAVMDIEELKDELSTIQHSQTPQGRDKWDTPEIKEPGGKKSRLRKDRYTALIIANIIAHIMSKEITPPQYHCAGGFVGQDRKKNEGAMYVGPDHIVSKMNRFTGRGV
jgi:hypothetical protein